MNECAAFIWSSHVSPAQSILPYFRQCSVNKMLRLLVAIHRCTTIAFGFIHEIHEIRYRWMARRRTRCVSLNGFLFKTWLFWRPIINYVDMYIYKCMKWNLKAKKRTSCFANSYWLALDGECSFEMHAVHDVVVVSRRHMYLLGGYYSCIWTYRFTRSVCKQISHNVFLRPQVVCVTRPNGVVDIFSRMGHFLLLPQHDVCFIFDMWQSQH